VVIKDATTGVVILIWVMSACIWVYVTLIIPSIYLFDILFELQIDGVQFRSIEYNQVFGSTLTPLNAYVFLSGYTLQQYTHTWLHFFIT